jgi:DNA polymerase III epsilon subunit-like protein
MYALILDTETTDLIKNSLVDRDLQPRVTEFYGQLVTDDGDIIDKLEFLCDPGVPIPAKVQQVTGITDDMVKGKGPFHEHIEDLIALFAKASAVVAHNLAYDYAVLNHEFARAGMEGEVPWPMIKVCTVQETEWFKGHRLPLGALHELLIGEPHKGAHRAREDVEALTRCWLKMREMEMV